MHQILILPGYGNSGPEHWQSFWEAAHPEYRRVQQAAWEAPACKDWVAALDRAVSGTHDSGTQIILVAHSLACLLVAHWAAAYPDAAASRIEAALLVAPPDPSGPAFPTDATGFSPLPMAALPFRSLVVASTDDPYATVEYCLRCSQGWGSRFEVIGPKGHINSASGLGPWEEGARLLDGLARG
jgi:predicted alpha/beta hydrolase family esterase